jgi:hypothetical protein
MKSCVTAAPTPLPRMQPRQLMPVLVVPVLVLVPGLVLPVVVLWQSLAGIATWVLARATGSGTGTRARTSDTGTSTVLVVVVLHCGDCPSLPSCNKISLVVLL